MRIEGASPSFYIDMPQPAAQGGAGTERAANPAAGFAPAALPANQAPSAGFRPGAQAPVFAPADAPPADSAYGREPSDLWFGPSAQRYGPIVVDISPQARAAYDRDNAQGPSQNQETPQIEIAGVSAAEGPQECQTCKNRKYVDQSDDGSVSFQAPTHISPGQAAGAVMSHEREHVSNEQARANRDNRRVVSQTVSLSTSVCPECGRVYVSGGVTRTVTASGNSAPVAEADAGFTGTEASPAGGETNSGEGDAEL